MALPSLPLDLPSTSGGVKGRLGLLADARKLDSWSRPLPGERATSGWNRGCLASLMSSRTKSVATCVIFLRPFLLSIKVASQPWVMLPRVGAFFNLALMGVL